MKKAVNLLLLGTLFLLMFSCSSSEDKLFKAIKKGDLNQVISLVENGVSVITNDRNGLSPLDIARLNGQDEIAKYLYDQTKDVLDKEIEDLIKSSFSNELKELKSVEINRKKSYELYSSSNDDLINSITDDKRVSDEIIRNQEKYFKDHQKLIREFINMKVDLIENILEVFIDRDYISSIESKDCRHIVNVNIMHKLSKME